MSRCQHTIEESMSRSQFGFRPGKGTTDAKFILRQIIEKAKEYRVPLHFNFVDLKAALDTIWREALWKMLHQTGIPPKYVSIIKNLYEDTKCAVNAGGQFSDWFQVMVGVRQGCMMSPSLCNIYLEYVIKDITSLDRELQLKDDKSISVRYADDTTLISAIFDKPKISTTEL